MHTPRERMYDYEPEEWDYMCERFADPGGESALHPETADNPRDQDCPTCGAKRVLTRRDRASGYHCDACARQVEMGY